MRLAAELGLAAGVASAVGLAVTGHAHLTAFAPREGVRLAGVSTVGADQKQVEGSLFPDLRSPFGSAGVPLPSSVPLPTWPSALPPPPASTPAPVAWLPVRILPPPPAPTAPPAAPTAPAAPPRQPPVALGPGSSTRAPQPQPARGPVRTPSPVTAPPRPAPAAPPPPPVLPAQLQGPAAMTLEALNQSRSLDGLGGLTADAALTRAALEHAAQIAAAGQMTHTGYVDDVNQQGVSWQGLGEVLGADATTPDPNIINELWLASPEHRPILLDPGYTAVGVGWARGSNGWWYVSAIFKY